VKNEQQEGSAVCTFKARIDSVCLWLALLLCDQVILRLEMIAV
jgi:hypothetical protein